MGNTGFRASLELLVNHGIDNVSNAIHETTNNVIERLKQVGCTIQSARDDKHWSGIVSFDVPGKDPFAVKEFATSRDVVVNARNGHVRISPHAYTNETDIERLMEIVNNC